MNKKTWSLLLVAVMVLSLTLSACSDKGAGQEEPPSQVVKEVAGPASSDEGSSSDADSSESNPKERVTERPVYDPINASEMLSIEEVIAITSMDLEVNRLDEVSSSMPSDSNCNYKKVYDPSDEEEVYGVSFTLTQVSMTPEGKMYPDEKFYSSYDNMSEKSDEYGFQIVEGLGDDAYFYRLNEKDNKDEEDWYLNILQDGFMIQISVYGPQEASWDIEMMKELGKTASENLKAITG